MDDDLRAFDLSEMYHSGYEAGCADRYLGRPKGSPIVRDELDRAFSDGYDKGYSITSRPVLF